ncbi:16S rRNA (guanine(966)-N(2))-methyltransferase RsmD [Cohnella faecalis]|uniref:16S rRNA (Guanine(966)-N(2))-methyltransferase RsmD n=1 Tax=Cohnella faecalis TaxID=2315694 RepID=A0A398CPN3_9BACL|nr:16S rRNA (guanine(966)-N(2))-methyltransferase RsmD [Cohnella faecalis]RIE04503.1 16S rRNA (guanine(966)-N(2))-methyltransferase RsmD [Cohnella faecalis]
MRVISGEAKGRPLKAVPGNTTRPTTDKVKEAMFSIIGPYFDGDRVLDLFAGTGGLGIEALSRGAGEAVFVDANVKSIEVIRQNLDATRFGERSEVYRMDARKAIAYLVRKGTAFDLLFLDPPYATKDCDLLLQELASKGLVADKALAVVEHDSKFAYDEAFGGFTLKRHVKYGEIALSVYRYDAGRNDAETSSDEGGER